MDEASVVIQNLCVADVVNIISEFSEDNLRAILDVMIETLLYLKISETPRSNETTLPSTSHYLAASGVFSCCRPAQLHTVRLVHFSLITLTSGGLPEDSASIQQGGVRPRRSPRYRKGCEANWVFRDTEECGMLWFYRK